MRILTDNELIEASELLIQTKELAKSATCLKRKCGSIIVKDGLVMSEGFNSPPKGLENQRRCEINKNSYNAKITDKSCCVHAEVRAIFNALRNNEEKLEGSRLYFASHNEEYGGKPYCTGCSKLILDVGIGEIVLGHREGIFVYDAREYNLISFGYGR